MDENLEQREFVDLPGFAAFEPAWAEFSQRHTQWLAERLSENEVVYRLPERVHDLLATNLQIDDADQSAEAAFDELCRRFRAVAVWDNRLIPYRWFVPAPAPFPKSQLEAMTALGWTREQVRKVPGRLQAMGDVSKRLQSIAGRRVCNPQFLEERDRVRREWSSLPDIERPLLPLSRSSQYERIDDHLEAKRATTALADFLSDFDYFCDRWALLGMATWDLPDPGNLNWPDLTSRTRSSRAEALTYRIPLEFPILDSDGLGAITRDQHAAAAQEHGITDLKRWETYARFLGIDHYERVLSTRYAGGPRPRNYVIFLEATIGKILHLDLERVHKLRKWMRALKSGRRTNLPSSR